MARGQPSGILRERQRLRSTGRAIALISRPGARARMDSERPERPLEQLLAPLAETLGRKRWPWSPPTAIRPVPQLYGPQHRHPGEAAAAFCALEVSLAVWLALFRRKFLPAAG